MLKQAFTEYAHIIQLKADTYLPDGEDPVKALRRLIVDIRDALPPEQTHFLKDRSEDQIEEHFAKDNLVFAAVDKHGALVGCAMMSDLSDPACADFFGEHYGEDNLVNGNWAIHTVGVHPDHTGHKLMAAMIGGIKSHIASDPFKFDTLVAKVSDNNGASRKNFLEGDFTAASHGHDKKGYDYTRFALKVAAPLAPGAEMPLNTTHVSDSSLSAPAFR